MELVRRLLAKLSKFSRRFQTILKSLFNLRGITLVAVPLTHMASLCLQAPFRLVGRHQQFCWGPSATRGTILQRVSTMRLLNRGFCASVCSWVFSRTFALSEFSRLLLILARSKGNMLKVQILCLFANCVEEFTIPSTNCMKNMLLIICMRI